MKIVISKATIIAILLSSFNSLAHAGSGLQACLEVYQSRSEEYQDQIRKHNQAADQTKYLPLIKPSHFPKIPGPWSCINNHLNYELFTHLTLGILPAVHFGVKGIYDLSTLCASAILDATVVPAVNLVTAIEKSVKTKKVIDPYEREIELVTDLIQYNENNIDRSPLFQEIANKKSIKKIYDSPKDIYAILKLAFEKQLYCSNDKNFVPTPLKNIIRDLKSGKLASAVNYAPSRPQTQTDQKEPGANRCIQ